MAYIVFIYWTASYPIICHLCPLCSAPLLYIRFNELPMRWRNDVLMFTSRILKTHFHLKFILFFFCFLFSSNNLSKEIKNSLSQSCLTYSFIQYKMFVTSFQTYKMFELPNGTVKVDLMIRFNIFL